MKRIGIIAVVIVAVVAVGFVVLGTARRPQPRFTDWSRWRPAT